MCLLQVCMRNIFVSANLTINSVLICVDVKQKKTRVKYYQWSICLWLSNNYFHVDSDISLVASTRMHLSPQWLRLLSVLRQRFCCCLLLQLWDSVLFYLLLRILLMQSSWWEREGCLRCLVCLPGVSWLLWSFFSQCQGCVCILWLWYCLIILTYYSLKCIEITSLSQTWYAITSPNASGYIIRASTWDFQQCGMCDQ